VVRELSRLYTTKKPTGVFSRHTTPSTLAPATAQPSQQPGTSGERVDVRSMSRYAVQRRTALEKVAIKSLLQLMTSPRWRIYRSSAARMTYIETIGRRVFKTALRNGVQFPLDALTKSSFVSFTSSASR
jgi:hypothetical protein